MYESVKIQISDQHFLNFTSFAKKIVWSGGDLKFHSYNVHSVCVCVCVCVELIRLAPSDKTNCRAINLIALNVLLHFHTELSGFVKKMLILTNPAIYNGCYWINSIRNYFVLKQIFVVRDAW